MRPAPTLSDDEVERGYNNRAAVPDHPQWFARWGERAAAAVASERAYLFSMAFPTVGVAGRPLLATGWPIVATRA